MANPKFQSPKGVKDIFSPESEVRRKVLDIFAKQARLAGYGEIVLPLFEDIGVFSRVGESTEIVQKQMYDFQDKDNRQMALRPESTASVMRAFIQHRPVTPWKCWYEGAHFRYEKPQAGRFRQFHQVGVEVLGTNDPAADTEVISLAAKFFQEIGCGVEIVLNSLGGVESRANYLETLRDYLTARNNELSAQAQKTLSLNPLRVLDSKVEGDAAIISEAPEMKLSADDQKHFDDVKEKLESLNIAYTLNKRLVRGLDYYTRTAFEFIATNLDSSQDAVGGGGRYDGLSELLGGPKCAGVGFAIGIDRTLLALEETQKISTNTLDVFIAYVGAQTEAIQMATELRQAEISTEFSFDNRSLKAQMKLADKSGAKVALILGEDEMKQNSVSVIELRKASNQSLVPQKDLKAHLLKLLNA